MPSKVHVLGPKIILTRWQFINSNLIELLMTLRTTPWCHYITLLITHDNKRKQWWVVDIWHWITPLLKVFMSKTDCQLIMKDISRPMRGHTTKLWTIRSWYYKGCFCTMYNSRDWRVDVGITEWLSGPWMTPGIWSDHVWCEHVTVTKSQSINTSGINYINPLRSEDLGFNRE